jgi:hypothetical protein
MKIIALCLLLLSVSGCTRQRIGLDMEDPDVYKRAEVDAINAVAECKAMARNMVQISRCETRR